MEPLRLFIERPGSNVERSLILIPAGFIPLDSKSLSASDIKAMEWQAFPGAKK
jgi:hypothetical protein